jgi:hypothetical protein
MEISWTHPPSRARPAVEATAPFMPTISRSWAALTHTFNQSSILDARVGFTWTQGGKTPYLAGVTSLNAQAGIPGLPRDPTVIRALSSENVTGFTSWGAQNSNPQFQNPFVIDPKINYSILRGRDSIKVRLGVSGDQYAD